MEPFEWRQTQFWPRLSCKDGLALQFGNALWAEACTPSQRRIEPDWSKAVHAMNLLRVIRQS